MCQLETRIAYNCRPRLLRVKRVGGAGKHRWHSHIMRDSMLRQHGGIRSGSHHRFVCDVGSQHSGWSGNAGEGRHDLTGPRIACMLALARRCPSVVCARLCCFRPLLLAALSAHCPYPGAAGTRASVRAAHFVLMTADTRRRNENRRVAGHQGGSRRSQRKRRDLVGA